MAKLKVGDITIENGSISFSQHQTTNILTTNTEPVPTAPSQHTPHKESNLKETMVKIPGSPLLWVGLAILSPAIALIVSITFGTFLLVFAMPFVFFGIFSIGVAFVKRAHAQTLKKKALVHEQNLLLDSKSKLQSVLEKEGEKWTFEKIADKIELSQEELLLALKACIDEKRVEEELDTNTGDWYYVWQEPEKEVLRPKSLDERLQEMNKK